MGEDVENRELAPCGGLYTAAATVEGSMEVPHMTLALRCRPAVPRLDMCLRRMKLTWQRHVLPMFFCSIIYNRQDVETACSPVSIDGE